VTRAPRSGGSSNCSIYASALCIAGGFPVAGRGQQIGDS
jgi:hypothetical protein